MRTWKVGLNWRAAIRKNQDSRPILVSILVALFADLMVQCGMEKKRYIPYEEVS